MYIGQCDLCKVTFNSEEQQKAHESGRKHLNKVAAAATTTDGGADVLGAAAGIGDIQLQPQSPPPTYQPAPPVQPQIPPQYPMTTGAAYPAHLPQLSQFPPQLAAHQYPMSPHQYQQPIFPPLGVAVPYPVSPPQVPIQYPPSQPGMHFQPPYSQAQQMQYPSTSQAPQTQPNPPQPMNNNVINVNISGLPAGAVSQSGVNTAASQVGTQQLSTNETSKVPGQVSKVPEAERTYCELCNKDCFNTNNYQQHIRSNKHLRKDALNSAASLESPVKREPSQQTMNSTNPTYAFYCEKCQRGCNSETSYNEHLESAAHIRKMNDSNLNAENWRCEVCNISCGSENNWRKHNEGQKHKKKEAARQTMASSAKVSQPTSSGDTIAGEVSATNDQERAFFELKMKIVNIVKDDDRLKKFKDIIQMSKFMNYTKRYCDNDKDCETVLKHLEEVETFNKKNVKSLLDIAEQASNSSDGSWWREIAVALKDYMR